ncbi:putative tRNA pseudouridine synthase D [Candidatus Bilamarchaeum dharawalense]|uniref:Probable tRNA pseudouridine synthase D n=1 Tax=Candidatus Bilamarchaeum dharawalense TaxID=2885759 RepID=A0A5E4LNE3_9ARCH|nr:putative tRNA pseudouridine synthase D [Candidatus Bilamarchaeum dharawalense]
MNYLSKIPGIGGKIKSLPEDFLVEEIATDGTIFELDHQVTLPDSQGKFIHFVLQKKNWSTSSALSEISGRLQVSQNRFNTAGIKDKMSISIQLASVSGVPKENLGRLNIRDISINGTWSAPDRVHMGDLLGNRFTIIVRDSMESSNERVQEIITNLDKKFPNYFGEQRFGSTRKNTHLIGQKILEGKLEDAVFTFLCAGEGETNLESSAARKELSETRNFSQALKVYPKHLRLERSMIAYLDRHPTNYLNALRCLPRNILLLFVHALQSHLFNVLLSNRIGEADLELEQGEYFCGETLGFPDIGKSESEGWICGKLIGYTSPINDREKEILEKFGLSKENFKIKEIPEIASKGTYRPILSPLRDFSFSNATFRFSLTSGSYATVALREFLDIEK